MTNFSQNLVPLTNTTRGFAIHASEAAGQGHPGASMEIADVAVDPCANHFTFVESCLTGTNGTARGGRENLDPSLRWIA